MRAAQVIARDSTPQREYWHAGSAPLLDLQGADNPTAPVSANELVEEFGPKRVSVVGDPARRARNHGGAGARWPTPSSPGRGASNQALDSERRYRTTSGLIVVSDPQRSNQSIPSQTNRT